MQDVTIRLQRILGKNICRWNWNVEIFDILIVLGWVVIVFKNNYVFIIIFKSRHIKLTKPLRVNS